MLGRRIAQRIAAGAAIVVALGGVATVAAANTGTNVVTVPPPASGAQLTMGSTVGFNGQQLMWASDAVMARELDGVAATGSRWLRVDFPWSSLEAGGRGRYNWAQADRLVTAANARGIHLLAMVAYTPTWDRPANTNDHYQPTDPTAYAEFMRAAAQRYAPRGLHAWEIWNEPNMRDFWQPVPSPARYTQLLRLASAAIHSVDRSAYVVSGGVAPARDVAGYSIAPNEFVAAIYANGGRGAMQAVGLHPYSFPYAPMTPASWNTFYMATQTHAIMAAHGDGARPIWATEIGWPTGTGHGAVSEAQQAVMAAAAITAWNRFSFAGNFFWFNWQDTSANPASTFDNLGVLRYNGTAKPALGVFKAMLARPAAHIDHGPPAYGPWLVGANAHVFATGMNAAPAAGGARLNQPITGSARTPSGHGVWMTGSDGGVFAYGDAAFYGSTGALRLAQPIVGMAATPDGHGYWLVASDGGVFSFGDAAFYGSTGARRLNQPIVGMAATPDGRGYWLVASDGGVFSFGDAAFYGSTGGLHIARPIVGLARSATGRGYWMVASDGGIFTFGDAAFYGSAGGTSVATPVVGIATTATGHGYWLAESGGTVHSFGDAGIADPVAGETITDVLTP
jgi:hypothetical protein